MDNILAPIQDAFEGQIVSTLLIPSFSPLITNHAIQDFHGQQLAETLSTVLLIISGVRSNHLARHAQPDHAHFEMLIPLK